jgi:hypothetical protein
VKDEIGPLKDSYNQLISDNGSMCELLDEYFGTDLYENSLESS